MSDKVDQMQEVVRTYEAMCRWCRAGLTEECVTGFDSDTFCPPDKVTAAEYATATAVLEAIAATAPRAKSPVSPGDSLVVEVEPDRPRYDSGYIHPGAWRFQKNIGEFTDPESTGRKMVKRMYPIGAGVACEWAGKRVLGLPGGTIIGCINNPATDWHHGPDKNTLNNEKASLGVGASENVHIICSPCHNLAHAQIDDYYPPYDRVLEQDRPWLPMPGEWGPITLEPAGDDELLEQQRARMADARRRGRTKTGRVREVVASDDDGFDED